MSGRHKDGKEYLDDTPVAIPAGFKKPESIHEMIRRYIRSEQFASKMQAQGKETEEEANDFEVGDEEDVMLTRHEFAAMAGDEAMRLHTEEKVGKIRERMKGARKDGSLENQSGTASVGSDGKATAGAGESESGVAAGVGEKAPGAAKPAK